MYFSHAYLAVTCIALFEIVIGLTVGGIHWIYIPEITTDIQFGFVAAVHYLNGVLISMVSESMFKYMRPEGTFLYYTLISLAFFIFDYYFFMETNGLSDK